MNDFVYVWQHACMMDKFLYCYVGVIVFWFVVAVPYGIVSSIWDADFATKVWTTEDGRQIKLRDMGDSHLLHTLKFLIRKATREQAAADWQILDAGGTLTMEQRNKPWTDFVFDIYWDMMKEYTSRGLSIAWLHPYISRCILNTLSEDIDDMVDVVNSAGSGTNSDHGY